MIIAHDGCTIWEQIVMFNITKTMQYFTKLNTILNTKSRPKYVQKAYLLIIYKCLKGCWYFKVVTNLGYLVYIDDNDADSGHFIWPFL